MSHDLSPQDLETRLWEEIDKERFGMLGVGAHHMQPMTMFADKSAGKIWFYSNKDTDLAREAGGGAQAMLCLMSKDQDFQACIGGALTVDYEKAKVDEYWSVHVSAWFPQGKDDPGLTLLRFDVKDAQVWVSKRGPLKYGFEVAKANATHTLPDIGTKAELKLGS